MTARRRCVLALGPQIPSTVMSAKAVPRFKENPGMMVGDGAVAAWWGRKRPPTEAALLRIDNIPDNEFGQVDHKLS